MCFLSRKSCAESCVTFCFVDVDASRNPNPDRILYRIIWYFFYVNINLIDRWILIHIPTKLFIFVYQNGPHWTIVLQTRVKGHPNRLRLHNKGDNIILISHLRTIRTRYIMFTSNYHTAAITAKRNRASSSHELKFSMAGAISGRCEHNGPWIANGVDRVHYTLRLLYTLSSMKWPCVYK